MPFQYLLRPHNAIAILISCSSIQCHSDVLFVDLMPFRRLVRLLNAIPTSRSVCFMTSVCNRQLSASGRRHRCPPALYKATSSLVAASPRPGKLRKYPFTKICMYRYFRAMYAQQANFAILADLRILSCIWPFISYLLQAGK